MKRGLLVLLFLIAVFITHWVVSPGLKPPAHPYLKVEQPSFVLRDVPFDLTLVALTPTGETDGDCQSEIIIKRLDFADKQDVDSLALKFNFESGRLVVKNLAIPDAGNYKFEFDFRNIRSTYSLRVLPGFLSLLPPILAIVVALIARRVLIALFCGIWLGAGIVSNYDPLTGFLRVLDTYLIQSLAHPDHVAIIMFSMTLGGMVGVISKSGGTRGIVDKITQFANHRRGGLLVTWALGLLIFFDDYANTLIVGNTMRPFTDKLKISREKLSYIVDSTAAPVASLFPISTWVGFQIALIAGTFEHLHLQEDAYLIFIESIPYASYSVLAILFVFLNGITLRDFGPMLKSEIRAAHSGKVLRDGALPITDSSGIDTELAEDVPRRWFNALIPIFTVIIVTLLGLYFNGKMLLGATSETVSFREIISAANSFHVLMWAAFSGAIMAIMLAVTQKILTIPQAIEAWLSGVKAMVLAMIILVLAWSIGQVCEDLMTAQYVIRLTESILSPHYLPLITFIISALIGFATGTSWATMAILIPIVVPIAYQLALSAALSPPLAHSILLGTIGAVLSGSVFGDHSSPISDTTIMSSMASAADHIDHVRTQLPYALLAAVVAILTGYLPAGFGFNIYFSLLLGAILLILVLFLAGKSAVKIK